MKPDREGWNIVLAGGWNPRIFTSEWLGQYVYGGADVTVEFPLQPLLPYRYSAHNVRVTASQGRVVLVPDDLTDAILGECERQALAILTELPHTPLSGVGTNLRYMEDTPASGLLEPFGFKDSAGLASAGYAIEGSEILRNLQSKEGIVAVKLNLMSGVVTLSFNFHRTASRAGEAANLLRGAVLADRERAKKLIKDVYNIDVQETP